MSGSNGSTYFGFEDFRKLATDDSLSQYEKIGFPDSYRQGFEDQIFEDIRTKLPNLSNAGATVFGYRVHVHDPERYGVVTFDKNGRAVSLVEKPSKPNSR